MNKNIKNIFFFFILFFLINCSFDNKTGIWKDFENIEPVKVKPKKKILIKLTKDESVIEKQFNRNLQIILKEKPRINTQWLSSDLNLFNSIGHISFKGAVKKVSKFKFKLIENYQFIDPDLIISNNYLIFHDNNGSILKFDKERKRIWKTNIYDKREKNKIFNVGLAVSQNQLFVTDNLGHYYSINLIDGKIVWKKKNLTSFNSQIKIKEKKLFIIDSENTLWCFSTKDGSELWNVRTDSSLIKTTKKLSIIINNNSVTFTNSLGDLTKVNIENGDLIWQSPTQNTLIQNETNFLKTSDIVFYKGSVFLSNNNNQFYSYDFKSGTVNWIQNINSSVRPVIIDDLVFTISNKGYLIIINSKTGDILRSTYIFDKFKEKHREKIKIEGFIVASNKVYVSTSWGYLIVCSVFNGKTESIFKISKFNKLSEPFITDNDLFVIMDRAIIHFK